MRKSASKLDNISLLLKYTNISRSIGMIIYKNKYYESKENTLDIPIFIEDKYAGMYAEILYRMGESEESIAIALRENTLLNYKNGEEFFFCRDKCKACGSYFYPQELRDGKCKNCNK